MRFRENSEHKNCENFQNNCVSLRLIRNVILFWIPFTVYKQSQTFPSEAISTGMEN